MEPFVDAALVRYRYTNQYTQGLMAIGNDIIYTLEPPWRDNARNVSCIPKGIYNVRYLSSSESGKYKDVYHVQAVEGRSGILIHKGNLPRHTLGCILPGLKAGPSSVLMSAMAMSILHKTLGRKSFTLRIL